MKILTVRQYLDVEMYYVWQLRFDAIEKAKKEFKVACVVHNVCDIDEADLQSWLKDNDHLFGGDFQSQYSNNIVAFEKYEDAVLLLMSQ